MSDYTRILISVLIFISSGIMFINIIRFRKTVAVMKRFDLMQNIRLGVLSRFQQGLMVFFWWATWRWRWRS